MQHEWQHPLIGTRLVNTFTSIIAAKLESGNHSKTYHDHSNDYWRCGVPEKVGS